jgi:hypothetical protein
VVGLLVLVVGVAGVAWPLGWLERWVPRTTDRLDVPWLADAAERDWWPLVLGVVGVLLVMVGLRWLVAHLPSRRLRDVGLPGTAATGRLTADPGAVAAAAATVVQDTPGVRTARGRALDDRARRTVELTVTIEPTADLETIRDGVERVLAEVAHMLSSDLVSERAHIRVAPRERGAQTRVA